MAYKLPSGFVKRPLSLDRSIFFIFWCLSFPICTWFFFNSITEDIFQTSWCNSGTIFGACAQTRTVFEGGSFKNIEKKKNIQKLFTKSRCELLHLTRQSKQEYYMERI